jgi:peptidoglycan-N-acetylglucosamine deacetylase
LSRPLSAAAVGATAVWLAHSTPALTFVPAVRRAFPGLEGVGRPDHVALTFDDGPDDSSTPLILDELAALGVRATFFLLGEMVERSPATATRLAADGHEIALHGWHHRNSLWVPPHRLRRSLVRALDRIEATVGVRPTLYRPPYGVLTVSSLWAARSLGLTPVLWGAWGKDWSEKATPLTVAQSLAPDLTGGVTVLLHDSDCTSAPQSWRSTLGALRPLIERLRERGLTVGPLREHRATSLPAPAG